MTFLSLLSPLVATLLGALMLDEWFSSIQLLGAIVILSSAALGMALSHRNRRPATNRQDVTRNH